MMSTCLRASIDAGLQRFMGVHDLNFDFGICDAFGFIGPGVTHERGQDAIRTSHGVCALEDLWSNHRASSWRLGCAHSWVRRPVSGDGVCTTDVARVLARHRGVPDGKSRQAVSHGHEGDSSALHAVGCAQPSRLAHLSCAGDAPDPASQRPLCQRLPGHRSGCDGLRTGLHDDRLVLVLVRLGTLSLDQSGGEDAHPAGLARCHSGFHPHQRWQDARRQCARYSAHGAGCLLRDGSGLRGFLQTLQDASGRCLLCHSGQEQYERSAGLFHQDRPQHGRGLRSTDRHEWLLRCQGLSRAFAARAFQGSRDRQKLDIPDQQHDLASVDHRCTVQEPLAGGVVLQVDQAALANQEISGHQSERGEGANLVRRVHLRADRHRQEGASTQCLALHIATDSFSVGFRENPDFMRLAA